MSKFLLLFLLCLVSLSLCDIDANPPDAVECGIRELALNYSQQLVARYSNRVYDALQLDECPNSIHLKHHKFKSKKNTNNNANAGATAYYVDVTNGNDNNDGTSMQNAFKTIGKAKMTVQQDLIIQKENNKFSAISIDIREGNYYESPLEFTVQDSGLSSQTPVIYRSWINNKNSVVISGGTEMTLQFTQTNWNSNIFESKLDNYECSNASANIFDQLFVNVTTRLIRARSPNGNPETDVQPIGYANAIGEYGGQRQYTHSPMFINSTNVARNSSIYPWFGLDNDPRGGGIRYHVSGDAERYSDNKGFWMGSVPNGMKYNKTNGKIVNANTWNVSNGLGVINVFHEALWGNWIFEFDTIDAIAGEIGFSRGGWQEGRGGQMSSGSYNQEHPQPFYAENVMEMLDSESEWYFDCNSKMLYLFPNASININAPLTVQIPSEHTILKLEGDNRRNTVNNLQFNGLTFTHSLRTQLLDYEVPSGGDWSILRGGAVFIENTKNILFDHCVWLRTGGNALFLSDFNKNFTVSNSDFMFIGDSAIAVVGRSALMDGFSDISYSCDVNIISNYMELIGVYGKQTSALFTSVAGAVNMIGNVLHSGPRAGININDGFYGGKVITNNLIFNWVRETQDHGPINTWDRVMYVFNDGNGNAVQTPIWNRISHNLIYNGPSGNRGTGNLFPAIDNDDGSRMYWMSDNVMVYGGAKNYLGDDKIWNDNLLIYPDHWPGSGLCIVAWAGLNHRFTDNQCITKDHFPLGYIACNPHDFAAQSKEMPFGENNQIYVTDAKFSFDCNGTVWSLEDLQQRGWEIGSVVQDIPSDDAIINMAKNKIMLN